MNATTHPDCDNGLNQIETIVKQQGVDWSAVAELAKHRDRDSKRKRKKLLVLLDAVRVMLAEVKNDLTPDELAVAQNAVLGLAEVLAALATPMTNDNTPGSSAT